MEPKRREKTARVCGQGPVRAAEGGGGTQLLPSVLCSLEGRRVLAIPQRQVGTHPSHSLQCCWGFSPRALGSACPGVHMFWKGLWHPGPRGVEVLRLACSLVSDKPWVGEACPWLGLGAATCPLGWLLGLNVPPRVAGLCRPRGAGWESMNPVGLGFSSLPPWGAGADGGLLGKWPRPHPTSRPPALWTVCQAVVGDPHRGAGDPGQVTQPL